MLTFPHYIASAEATYRIESLLAYAEHHRLLHRLRRARKAAAASARWHQSAPGPGP
jgi:hypothetical protein